MLLLYNILGFIWPMESAHPIIRCFNRFLHLSIASETIGNLILRGWPLQHPMILQGVLLIILWLIVFALPVFCFSLLKKDAWLKPK